MAKGDDRGASAAVQDKQDKAAKELKEPEAATSSESVAISKLEAATLEAGSKARDYFTRLNPSAWFTPVQATWSDVVK